MTTTGTAPRAAPGDILAGKYQVERVLGQGGMGMVVAARHVQLGTRVALKFLLPSAIDSQDTVARFLREAQTASLIASEHVTRVLDVGTLADGSPFIVMEYLDGRDLASIVRKQGRLPVIDAVDHALQTCEALAVAHAAGIVHRDLKPANLFLTTLADGSSHIKILDFGISKKHGLESKEHALTRTDSAIMGSPAYIPPEQIRSQKTVDGRADIWSLGVSLYELLSGQLPFMADNLGALIAAILADPVVPLRSRQPDVPPGLEAVVHGCLEKSVAARPANVAVLAQQLKPFGSPRGAASADRAVGTVARTTGGSLMAVQAVSASFLARHPSSPPPPSRAPEGTVVTRPLGTMAQDRRSSAALPPPVPPPNPADRRSSAALPPPPHPPQQAGRASYSAPPPYSASPTERVSSSALYPYPDPSAAPAPAAEGEANARISGTEIYVAPAAPPAAPPAVAAARTTGTEIHVGPRASAPPVAPAGFPSGTMAPDTVPPAPAAPPAASAAGAPSLPFAAAPQAPPTFAAGAAGGMPPPAGTITSGAWGQSSSTLPAVSARSRLPLVAGAGAAAAVLALVVWLVARSGGEAPAASAAGPSASPAVTTAASAPVVQATATLAPAEPSAAPSAEPSAEATTSAAPHAATTTSAAPAAPHTGTKPAGGGVAAAGAGTGAKPRPGSSSDLNKLIQNRK